MSTSDRPCMDSSAYLPSKKPRLSAAGGTSGSSKPLTVASSSPDQHNMETNGRNGYYKSDQQNGSSSGIDKSLYSRQIYVLGKAMFRMAKPKVLVSGLGGLGVEIAKNMCLGGVCSVTLQDTKSTTWNDLSSQFYLKKTDIGKNRTTQSQEQLSELNSCISVEASTEPLSAEFLTQFNVVVLTDRAYQSGLDLLAISRICHENHISFILAETRGVFSRVFCDYGKDFTVVDTNGERPIKVMIAGISKDETGAVTCMDEAGHGLQDGDHVSFSEVQGMTELDVVTGPYTFTIGNNTQGFSHYICGGVVSKVKLPTTLKFKSLEESMKDPEVIITYGTLAELEQALIRFTLDSTRDKDFELISVPDLLYPQVLATCGTPTTGDRNQVNSIEMGTDEKVCLTGTAEMGIRGLQQDAILNFEEPLRLAGVNRCYRSKVSTTEDERGVYRVHGFTKVEMFGVYKNLMESNSLHEEFLPIQQKLFQDSQLPFRTMEMPVNDLGNAAHRKFDIKAWITRRGLLEETLSTSNCSDYQARRLNIRYKDEKGKFQFAHAVNGTACALPRMLIALIETTVASLRITYMVNGAGSRAGAGSAHQGQRARRGKRSYRELAGGPGAAIPDENPPQAIPGPINPQQGGQIRVPLGYVLLLAVWMGERSTPNASANGNFFTLPSKSQVWTTLLLNWDIYDSLHQNNKNYCFNLYALSTYIPYNGWNQSVRLPQDLSAASAVFILYTVARMGYVEFIGDLNDTDIANYTLHHQEFLIYIAGRAGGYMKGLYSYWRSRHVPQNAFKLAVVNTTTVGGHALDMPNPQYPAPPNAAPQEAKIPWPLDWTNVG